MVSVIGIALYDCSQPINTHSAELLYLAHKDDDEDDVCDNDSHKKER